MRKFLAAMHPDDADLILRVLRDVRDYNQPLGSPDTFSQLVIMLGQRGLYDAASVEAK